MTNIKVQMDHACLTEGQLAQRWQISIAKLQNDRWRGDGIPFIKVGRLVRYAKSDIELFESLNRHIPFAGGAL